MVKTKEYGVAEPQAPQPSCGICRSIHRISALEQSDVFLNSLIGEVKQGLENVRREMAAELTTIREKLSSIEEHNARREKLEQEITLELAAAKKRDAKKEIRDKQSMKYLETMLSLLRESKEFNNRSGK